MNNSKVSNKIILSAILGIAVSFIICIKIYNFIDLTNWNKFNQAADNILLELSEGINRYAYGLKSAQGIFVSQNFKVTPDSFRQYAISRNFFKDEFPGAFGFGFIYYVKKDNFDTYLADAKNRQGSDYNIKTSHKYSDYFVIEYIEPVEFNKPAKGFDIGQEERRREAAEYAMKSGQITLTRRIQLVQDNVKRAGFLILNPTYSTPEIPNTEEDRINKFIGFTYSPLVINDIMKKSVKNYHDFIDFKIYENNEIKSENLLFDSDANSDSNLQISSYERRKYKKIANLEIKGQKWKIQISSKINDIEYNPFIVSSTVFALLQLILILILILLQTLLNRNEHAKKLADDLTIQLQIKQSELIESLEQSNFNLEQVKTIIDSIPGYVVWFDENLMYLGVNQELVNFFKLSEADIIGKKISSGSSYLTDEFVNLVVSFKQSNLERKTSFLNINLLNTKKYLMVNLRKFNNGKNIVLVSVDYTEQKKVEDLFQNSVAKSAYSSKMLSLGEMAGAISHEINNPLSIISSKSQLLKKQIESNSLDLSFALNALEKIIITTERISKIIRGLRVIARDGEQDIFMPVNINNLVDATIDLCATRFKNHGVTLTKDYIDPNLKIMGQETQLMQILLNLLNNAHDAVSSLPVKNVSIQVLDIGDYIDIKITDSGNGIPESIKDKLMMPFFTTKATGQGMGLGLSISRSIAESHNGILFVNYKSPNTQFILRLPK